MASMEILLKNVTLSGDLADRLQERLRPYALDLARAALARFESATAHVNYSQASIDASIRTRSAPWMKAGL